MLSYQLLNNVKTSVRSAIHSRNIGILAPCLQKATDPIQQLFVDKIREYKQKSNKQGASAAVDLISDIQLQLDNRKKAAIVSLDLRKAFDTVDHKILLEKMELLGICGACHLWFQNYLHNRKRGKNLVEPTRELEKELKQELEKVAKQYGGGPGVDMSKFPELKFQDPVLDPINLETK